MKRIAVAFALALSPLAVAGACATFEQVAKPARQYISDAESLWLGTAEIAGAMRSNGYLSPGQFSRVFRVLAEASAALDAAHALLRAGSDVAAGKSASEIFANLSALAYELATIRDTVVPVAPSEPVPTQFPANEI